MLGLLEENRICQEGNKMEQIIPKRPKPIPPTAQKTWHLKDVTHVNPWPPWILEFVRNLGTSTLNLQKSQALETPERRESLKLQVGTFEKLRPRRSQVFLPLVTWVRMSKLNSNIHQILLKGHPQIEIDLKSLWSIGQLQRCNGFVESQDSMAVSARLNWSYWTPFREATGNVAQEKTCWKLLGMESAPSIERNINVLS